MGDAGTDTPWILLAIAKAGSDGVGGLEADAGDITRQAIGIRHDDRDCFLAIGLEDPHCPRRTDSMTVKPDDDLADGALIAPTTDDFCLAPRTNAGDLAQPRGLALDNVEHVLAKRCHQLFA